MAKPSDYDLYGVLLERESAIRARFTPAGGHRCWRWTGAKTANGYGTYSLAVSDGKTRSVRAHRAVFMLYNGRPIREGYTLHHRCHTRDCVRPDHLVELTIAENAVRRTGVEALRTVLRG